MIPLEVLASGTIVADRFSIVGIRGHGGMGVVYAANQLSLDRLVALKVVHPRLATDPGARQRFLREARVSAALRHPNAVEIHDFGDDGTHLYIAMELLDGTTLRTMVDYDLPPVQFRHACRIARPIADVLAHAAAQGIVHRDLKPENIVLARSGDGVRVVVVDFGLAFRADHTKETGRITAEGMSSGTPDYMAPEQIRGLSTTPATDVYALGCCLYEMLTSRAPLVAHAPAITLSQHLFLEPTSIRKAFPELDVPAELDEIVLQMLAKDPRDRPSAGVVRDVLGRLERGGAEPSPDELDAKGRASRMISGRPAPSEDPGGASVPASVPIAVVGGRVDDETRLSLAANGFVIAEGSPRVVVVLSCDPELVREHAARGIPVIAEVDSTDSEGVARMIRAGATDVVPGPIAGPTLARRLARAIRNSDR